MFAHVRRFKNCSCRSHVAAAFIATVIVGHAGPSAAETAEERAACRPDVFRLCAGEIPSRNRIVTCLIRKRSQLSPACAEVFRPPEERR